MAAKPDTSLPGLPGAPDLSATATTGGLDHAGTDDAAAARLSVFAGRRGRQFALLAPFLCLCLALGFLGASLRAPDPAVSATGGNCAGSFIDLRVFWGAARLVLDGTPLAVFDQARLAQAYGACGPAWFPFLYPPALLAALTPLGLLPFNLAWAALAGLSLVAFALALRPFAGRAPHLWAGMAATPALLPALLVGQLSLLWAAGLLTAFAALRQNRQVLAGGLIAALSLKPTLGLLIPVALIAGGYWRALIVAALGTALLALVPTLGFGPAYWTALSETGAEHARRIAQGGGASLMVSAWAALIGLGLPAKAALALQWAITAALALLVWRVWRGTKAARPAPARTGFDHAMATLCAAIPLASPYLWHYDAVLLALFALFAWRAGLLPTGAGGVALFALFWTGPAVVLFQQMLPGLDRLPAFALVTPMVVAAPLLCLRQPAPAPSS